MLERSETFGERGSVLMFDIGLRRVPCAKIEHACAQFPHRNWPSALSPAPRAAIVVWSSAS